MDDQKPAYVRWEDPSELDHAAEAAYVEHELQIRGDGMWRPWQQLDSQQHQHWKRIAGAVLRSLNLGRMHANANAS